MAAAFFLLSFSFSAKIKCVLQSNFKHKLRGEPTDGRQYSPMRQSLYMHFLRRQSRALRAVDFSFIDKQYQRPLSAAKLSPDTGVNTGLDSGFFLSKFRKLQPSHL